MTDILEISHLTKRFGGLAAVNDVSFSVPDGGIVGLIGPNGAGKTTIFNLITGVYGLTDGKVEFMGKNIVGLPPYKIADAGITRTFQNIRLFKNLTVFENVLTACHLSASYNVVESVLRLPRFRSEEKALYAKAERLLEIMGLTERRDLVANNLPYGMQRRLEIVRALATRPRLLLLDEPAAGMNGEEVTELIGLLRRIRSEFDLTIVMIEHRMQLVMNLCERVVALNFGCVIADGTPGAIRSNPKVLESYLGSEAIL